MIDDLLNKIILIPVSLNKANETLETYPLAFLILCFKDSIRQENKPVTLFQRYLRGGIFCWQDTQRWA